MAATITLQVGNYANYVCSHLWNFQYSSLSGDAVDSDETYDSSELFRCIETSGGEVIQSPRAIVCDLRENYVNVDPYNVSNGQGGGGGRSSASSSSLPASLWGGVTTTIARADHSLAVATTHNDLQPVYDNRRGARFWSDYLQHPYHAKSVCEMPLWTTGQRFDTYFAGSSSELVPVSMKEDLLDRFRYFAEECDYLGCIRVFADLHDGFGGLTCAVVEELREDFPTTALQVWGFTEGSDAIHESATMRSNLQALGLPLSYARLRDVASLVVPIGNPRAAAEQLSPSLSIDGTQAYQSSAVMALAVEAAVGYGHFQRVNDGQGFVEDFHGQRSNADEDGEQARTLGPKDWCHLATKGGQLPFCALEACIPFPSAPPDRPATIDDLWDTFSTPDAALRGERGVASDARTTLNPFMRSLSAAAVGRWAAPLASRVRNGRAYSNLVSVRCPNCPGRSASLGTVHVTLPPFRRYADLA